MKNIFRLRSLGTSKVITINLWVVTLFLNFTLGVFRFTLLKYFTISNIHTHKSQDHKIIRFKLADFFEYQIIYYKENVTRKALRKCIARLKKRGASLELIQDCIMEHDDAFKGRLTHNLRFDKSIFRHLLFWLPVYTCLCHTDCDCVSSTSFHKYRNFTHFINSSYQDGMNAEGAYSNVLIPKEEYIRYKDESYKRDHIMEAYENGNGNSIIV